MASSNKASELQRIGREMLNTALLIETKQKLRELAEVDKRTLTLELEFLIEREWAARFDNKETPPILAE